MEDILLCLHIYSEHSVIYWLCKSVFETIKHSTQALLWPSFCFLVLWLLCNLPSRLWLMCFYKWFMLEAKHVQSTFETTTTHEILTHVSIMKKIAQDKKPIY